MALYDYPRGGTLSKSNIAHSHHISVIPLFNALARWFYHPFSIAKITSNYLKKSQNTSPQPPISGRLVKIPPFSRFHDLGTAGQKHPLNLRNGRSYWWILIKSPPWDSFAHTNSFRLVNHSPYLHFFILSQIWYKLLMVCFMLGSDWWFSEITVRTERSTGDYAKE